MIALINPPPPAPARAPLIIPGKNPISLILTLQCYQKVNGIANANIAEEIYDIFLKIPLVSIKCQY